MNACRSGPMVELAWMYDKFWVNASRIARAKRLSENNKILYELCVAWFFHVKESSFPIIPALPAHQNT